MSDNCGDALDKIYEYLDRELDEETLHSLESHLKDCSPCLEVFDFEAQLKKLVSERCREKVPDSVRAKIRAALDEIPPQDDSSHRDGNAPSGVSDLA